jgi:hypothetical protein
MLKQGEGINGRLRQRDGAHGSVGSTASDPML